VGSNPASPTRENDLNSKHVGNQTISMIDISHLLIFSSTLFAKESVLPHSLLELDGRKLSMSHIGRSGRAVPKSVLVILVASAISFAPFGMSETPSAHATVADNSVALYLSAPMVQGPAGTNLVIETFDSVAGSAVTGFRSCPASIAFATIQTAGSSQCNYYTPLSDPWGGASTTTSTPTFDLTTSGTMTPYGQASSGSVTFTLNQGAQYVGFWWTSGGPGNAVSFLDENDVEITSFSSAEINTKLGATDTTQVIAVDPSISYLKRHYLGHPAGHLSAAPTVNSARPARFGAGGWDTGGQYAFLNLYVGGSIAVKKIVFTADSGNAFEFDNLSISTDLQTPLSSMVKVGEKVSAAPAAPLYTVTFDANGGTGSMGLQTGRLSAALTSNTLTRSGFTFAGWNTAANGTGTSYANGSSYPFNASTTLYAQWTAIPAAPAPSSPQSSPASNSLPQPTAVALAQTGSTVSPAITITGVLLSLLGLSLVGLSRRLRSDRA